MRRFFGSSREDPNKQTAESDNAEATGRTFQESRLFRNDSNAEKTVSKAAQSFGEGVQNIVVSAKAKQNYEWKGQLLELLGQASSNTHLDTLITYTRLKSFVDICCEHDLPPNLVHCLRLLRVLELQNDTSESVSLIATQKVSRLLVSLCVSDIVGDQLRPHLFGLFALSGASYPQTGLHVCVAASDVIVAFGRCCLNNNLIWFIHDRKMIIHMTDDIKELYKSASHDILVIAITTIVMLLHYSYTNYSNLDLVADFESAGGYAVFADCLKGPKKSKLFELIPKLAVLFPDSPNHIRFNRKILELFANLMVNSNPLIENPVMLNTPGDLRALAKKALSKKEINEDLCENILSMTLQLFADQPDNYEILEQKMHVLTFSVLSIPIYKTPDVKRLVLKTFEMVLTGPDFDTHTPIEAMTEVFFVAGRADMELICSLFEKLLEFDQRVAPLMVETNLWNHHVAELLKTSDGERFSLVCRVLHLLVAHQPVYFRENDNLRKLLQKAIAKLSIDAALAASSVFEAFMSRFSSETALNEDMTFVLKLLETKDLARVSVILSMLRSVLEEKSLSRRSFRVCGGFAALLRVVLRVKHDEKETMDVLVNLMGLLDAAIGMKNRNVVTANEISPLQITADVNVDYVSSQLSSSVSASSSNRNYLRQNGFYLNLAAAIAGTGLLKTAPEVVLDVMLGHIDPDLRTVQKDILTIRNPDASRLAMGLAIFLPDARSGHPMSTQIMDMLLRLSELDRVATTLPRLANCGLCYSLTNPKEFGSVLFDTDHNLQSQFSLLLSRLAACSMSYMDFVSMLRNVAGPVMSNEDGYVRLPVISSSVRKKGITAPLGSERRGAREEQFVHRLETICEIASNADQNSRVILGGDSINTIAVLMHEIPLEERLKATAEEGRLKYLEIESIDASAILPFDEPESSEVSTPATETLWTPLAGSGFSYSMWMRHGIPIGGGTTGNLHVLDISHTPNSSAPVTSQAPSFLSVWYDLQNQRFNVMSSASYRGEPTCFPVSPLQPDSWHHILITYTPAKRSMIARKSAFCIYVDGRPLEAEVRVETVSLPPNSRLVIGAPNPSLAMTGVVRGILPVWELGPALLLATVLLDLDATAIYAYGPSFPGLLWGDRPERLSLAAAGTAMFSMLSTTGEAGSIASALRRRDVARLELSGYSAMGHMKKDSLATMNLFCNIPPECVVFGFQASTVSNRMRNEAVKKASKLDAQRLVNLARLHYGSDVVATDAVVYGSGSVVAPLSFSDCLRWVGGPHVLFPLVNAADSSRTLALSLQMIRLGSQEHRPNLEMLQARGGYRMLGVLLQGKGPVDEACLDQCLAFAIHSFEPDPSSILFAGDPFLTSDSQPSIRSESSLKWIFSDLDAMKQLLLNHQVWDLRRFGPHVPLRLLTILNIMVDHNAIHKAFNARRLHQIGIVRWALHSAIEAAELYAQSELKGLDGSLRGNEASWVCESPRVADVSVGGDPGNPFLLECKNLLRRVLTFMLTPGDLESLVQSIVFSESIGLKGEVTDQDDLMRPGPTLRLHLVRLLEELIVDGVNEIVATVKAQNGTGRDDYVVPHAGGVASPNQPYFSTASTRGKDLSGGFHPRHQQAQNFLTAFASFLTPTWFATVLEGCDDEASTCAVLRLMILMLQGSATFETAFRESGAFAPFVMSIPRFSTCPGVAIALLSQLLDVPILHLHSLPALEKEQLCEVFDAEGLAADYEFSGEPIDPSSGVFALLVECIGRNVQLVATKDELWERAATTNQAIIHLLGHQHAVSLQFREFCRGLSFLEPLAQALCLVYNEQLQPSLRRSKRPTLLVDVPKGLTPTERFIGSLEDPDSAGMGIVKLIRLIIADSVASCPVAAQIVYNIFRSFPVHASPQQVAAFHLVLIEHCCSVIDGVLQRGEGDALALANCVGLCSVLVDHEVGAFFTSEAALKTVTTTFSILDALLRFDTPAVYSISNTEHSLLTRDAAYMANLAAITALRISLPVNDSDRCDEELQSRILELVDTNISLLLLLPSRDRKSNWKVPTGRIVKPAQNSKLYSIWESSSISRCVTDRPVFFPDFYAVTNPDRVVVAPLLVSLHRLLIDTSDDIRSLAISILVALLQHRSTLLSELLVAEVKRNGQIELVDVVNRGGFKALMMAHEVANVADGSQSSQSDVKKRYSSFFEWFDRSQEEVQLVFNSVEKKAREAFPGLQETASTQEQTVENEQKLMLMRLSTRSAERSVVGGLEREELARLCTETTMEVHSEWRRGGFDDLAYGAMKWKFLLRQLKGSSSLWEGGSRFEGVKPISLDNRLALLRSADTGDLPDTSESVELVKRWKLDMTEGYEHQRRRLLPNYEFHGLYNLDEEHDSALQSSNSAENSTIPESSTDFLSGGQVEATAAMLKDLNIKRAHRSDDDLDETEVDTMSAITDSTTLTGETQSDAVSVGTSDGDKDFTPQVESPDGPEEGEGLDEEKESSGYELITGLLQAGDWPKQSYNVRRCTGLEVNKAIFLWCEKAVYVIDGFEIIRGDNDSDWKISRVERERSSFHINLRPKDFNERQESGSDSTTGRDPKAHGSSTSSRRDLSRPGQHESTNEVIYEHRSHRILLTELYSVYRRRYQLQQTGLEVYDTNRNSVLIAFERHDDREEILSKVIQSDIPNSIFGSGYGTSFLNYTKFMKNRKAKITSQWQNGKMTNFEFLMELNSLAGRSFHDLTQYPVFPWVIADYDSEELDLSDPKSFRDLSKPMGAIGEERAKQFRERYEALESTYFGDDDPPPFHYGTHYSCAAYVLYYLMRLEPFSRLALALQGGRFDVADRLFHDVGRSWKSASSQNLQDVRELIPEFYFLPDFLVNTNHFDFGETQRGKAVHDVTLPKWAKNDPKRFVRINRQALESEYVSRNLHQWVDLVFGFKQRGEEAVEALNTFVHVTYEGEVDIDAMTDPVQRQSTIAQIQNFGQTPSRLERFPFPKRSALPAVKDKSIDFSALPSLIVATPPLCVMGAPHRVHLQHVLSDACKLGLAGQYDPSVGEMCYIKGQLIATGKMNALIIPSKKYYRFGGLNNGVSVHVAAVTARYREINRLISMHDDLHRAPISAARASLNGNWLVTGCVDSTLRVWYYDGTVLDLRSSLCGHNGSHITCIDVSTECGVIASGCGKGKVLLWDLRTLTFVRPLKLANGDGSPVVSVSINHKNGNVVALAGTIICIYGINGNLIAQHQFDGAPTCAVATDCPEWMETGVAAVTGHKNGAVYLWSIDYETGALIKRYTLEGSHHSTAITALRVTGAERQDTLLVGDASGKVTVFKTVQLDTYCREELDLVVKELLSQKTTV